MALSVIGGHIGGVRFASGCQQQLGGKIHRVVCLRHPSEEDCAAAALVS